MSTLTVPEICARLGHSQQTHFLHYAHVISALSGERYEDLDAMIGAARGILMAPRGTQSKAGK